MPTTEEFKVKLVSAVDYSRSENLRAGKHVTFDVTPQISESGPVEYESIKLIHAPTTFQSYVTTPARNFTLSEAKLISRTPTEARDNIEKINILRSWRMPFFGQVNTPDTEAEQYFSNVLSSSGTRTVSPLDRLKRDVDGLKDRLGAPPEILYFSAYSSFLANGSSNTNRWRGNISRLPVVLTNLTINYPNDVTYIATAKRGNVDSLGSVPFPVIMTINVELVEAHSPAEVNAFNLAKYASGILDGF